MSCWSAAQDLKIKLNILSGHFVHWVLEAANDDRKFVIIRDVVTLLQIPVVEPSGPRLGGDFR